MAFSLVSATQICERAISRISSPIRRAPAGCGSTIITRCISGAIRWMILASALNKRGALRLMPDASPPLVKIALTLTTFFAPRLAEKPSAAVDLATCGLVLERIAHQYCVVPLRAGGEERHGRADQLLDAPHIFHRAGRQVAPGPGALGRLAPAFHLLIDGRQRRLRLEPGGQVAELPISELVAGADLQRLQAIEHIQLGERDAADAVQGHGLADQRRVEPAAAARAAGHRAELLR